MSEMQDDNLRRINQQNSAFSGMQGSTYSGRLAKVWVAYSTGDEGLTVLAVFPTKALADIFLEGANSAKVDEVQMIERSINYGG